MISLKQKPIAEPVGLIDGTLYAEVRKVFGAGIAQRAVAQQVFTKLTFEEVIDDHFLSNSLTKIPWTQLM